MGRDVEAQLVELGRRLPPVSHEQAKLIAANRASRFARRLAKYLAVLIVVVLLAGGAVQWLRPLPKPALVASLIRIAGAQPKLPWPSAGEAALSVPGIGSLGQDNASRPVPIGVLSGVLTAYVVLRDHPLGTGGALGPVIVVGAPTVAADRAGSAIGQPEVPVTLGEHLSELEALEGLLVDSGSDMASLLAQWDAGGTAAFVKKMDRDVASLGLRQTRVNAPGGANDAVISTPNDLIALAEAAMKIPLFRQIVSLGEVDLPGAGLRYNPNFGLSETGVIGIEAGSDTNANGCYLFAAHKSVDGQAIMLYGAVLGQSGPIGPDAAAVDAGDALTKVALSALTAVSIPKGRVVGRLVAPWGASTPIEVSEAVSVPAWPGLSVPVTTKLAPLTTPIAAGTRVGWLEIREGTRRVDVAVSNTAPLLGPSWHWRLTR